MKAFKKYITILAAAPMLWACSAEEGREPGTDPDPVVTVYSYPVEVGSGYNVDNDLKLRFVTNDKVSEVKYLVLPTSEAEALGEAGLLKKVESDGQKINDLGSNSYADITVTDLHGDMTIAAVANGAKLANRITFFGLDWNTIKTGTFFFNSDLIPIESTESALEVCTTDPTLYRLKDALAANFSIKFNILEKTGTNAKGNYTLFSVPDQATPWSYGDYGRIYIYDVALWQNNDAYITDPSIGYANFLYEDGNVDAYLVWHVAAGWVARGRSTFVPND